MAINQNRNSTRVLRTTAVGHLVHENIPNLSIGTGKDFTIQLWVLKGKDIDGVLYSQEGGFSIQLVDGQAVFSLDGFATLSSGTDWKVSAHQLDYIAVRCQSGTLALFLGGLKIAEKRVSAKVSACTGNYAIGKEFTGGFSLIRVSDVARSDQDILSDNAKTPAVDGHCVFQSDCSTAQYKDVSANHLSMWAEGEGAGCGIYTACTVFSGAGQVRCAPAESLDATHTLLLKLWPQDEQKTQCLYTAMDGAKTMYCVELDPQADHTFRLSVLNAAGGKATLSKPLFPELWQDVAAVFDGGKVKLYLDGKLDGAYPFSFSGSRTDVLVGAEYEAGRPSYDKGFSGYMAYTAEFGKALSAAEIALYADDPPFMFEDGLVSLLPLDWPDEVESVGATALSVTGTAPFQLVADITPRDGDVGYSLRIPTEVSPEWDKLSADEQWTLRLFDDLVSTTLTELCGCPCAQGLDTVPASSLITPAVRRHAGRVYQKLGGAQPPVNKPTIKDILKKFFQACGRKIKLIFGKLMGAVSAAWACFLTAVQDHVGLILGSLVGVTLIAAAGVLIANAQGGRPSDPTWALRVTGICWNHQGDPAKGSLHYHKGGANYPASMTDTPGLTRLETRCVLVPGKLQSPTVDVTLTYVTTGAEGKSGTLKACDLTDGGLLGEQSVAYTVGPNASVTVSLPYDTSKLPTNAFSKLTHTWQFWDGDRHLTNCVCTLYLLPSAPAAPWTVGAGTDYRAGEPGYVRTEFLDFFLPTGAQPEDLAAWFVQRLNAGGFVYDVAGGGACHYCDFHKNVFYLDKFLADAGQPGKVLNCADCAHIVATACALVGREMNLVMFVPPYGAQWFGCNRIIAIGAQDWRFPFDATGHTGYGVFSYHMFNTTGDALTADAPIYDACLQVDGGDYPGCDGSAGRTKKAVLPTGMPAKGGYAGPVNVPPDRPYRENLYRERLVLNGHFCDFATGYMKTVQGLDVTTVTGEAPPEPFLAAVMDAFSLAPTPEQEAAFAARRSGDWTPGALPGATLTWSGPDHNRWELEVNGQVCQVRHWRCDTAQEAAWRMAAQVASYTHPDKRPGEALGVEVGERCVVVAASQIVFCRRGHVLTVGAGTLPAALAVAKALDESVQAD